MATVGLEKTSSTSLDKMLYQTTYGLMPASKVSKSVVEKGTKSIRQALNLQWDGMNRLQQRETLTRYPNISDAEIATMPLSRFFGLYYSLLNFQRPKGARCQVLVPNPAISRGLSDAEATMVEGNLQRRMYSLRSDLRWMINPQNGTLVQVLIPMEGAPSCQKSDYQAAVGLGLTALSAVVTSIAGGGAGIVATLGTTAASASQQYEASKDVATAQKQMSNAQAAFTSYIRAAIAGLLLPLNPNNLKYLSPKERERAEKKIKLIVGGLTGRGNNPMPGTTPLGNLKAALDSERALWSGRIAESRDCAGLVAGFRPFKYDEEFILPSVRSLLDGAATLDGQALPTGATPTSSTASVSPGSGLALSTVIMIILSLI